MTASLADTVEVPAVGGVMSPALGGIGPNLVDRSPQPDRDVAAAGRAALRQARRHRHFLAAAGLGILLAALLATVAVIGVVR